MHLNIVVRATDPGALAEALGALGIDLEGPNRPNPLSWHGWGGATLAIERCEEGEAPSVALGFGDLPTRLADAGIATDGLAREVSTLVLEAGGVAIPLRRRDEPVPRPAGDQQLLPHAITIIEDARRDLARALWRTGARNPRLAGPQTTSRPARDAAGRFDPVFTLIVDGVDPAGAKAIGAVLARHGDHPVRIEVERSEGIDPHLLAVIDRLSWDLNL